MPQTKEEADRKKTPPSHWEKVRKVREFRERHDPAWNRATSHPLALYELCGLPTEGLEEYLGKPPEDERPKADKEGLREFRERFIGSDRSHRGV